MLVYVVENSWHDIFLLFTSVPICPPCSSGTSKVTPFIPRACPSYSSKGRWSNASTLQERRFYPQIPNYSHSLPNIIRKTHQFTSDRVVHRKKSKNKYRRIESSHQSRRVLRRGSLTSNCFKKSGIHFGPSMGSGPGMGSDCELLESVEKVALSEVSSTFSSRCVGRVLLSTTYEAS